MAAIFGANEQEDRPVDVDRLVTLANDVLIAERVVDEVEVNLLLVDESTIADLNERFLGGTGPTDVLSFPIDHEDVESGRSPDSGGRGPGGDDDVEPEITLLGDIVVCPQVAFRNAPEHAGTYEDELALLVVHGLLHLLGMDHHELDDAREMESREAELLEELWRPLPETTWATIAGFEILSEQESEAIPVGEQDNAGEADLPQKREPS